ncbi:hypothetical protein CHLNCDRAFT_53357 [Chlorella variabilis]|uniref:Amino acid transporter transmembrane domain-containing protein n=1 Tax=Chlorella variabilis TaxID=554065 RepID=E1ZJI2_CHLVA|nr:hypothetical protein CHLNCDRAFT_53357 [Chlorella variabilis]EFN53996.1 hypothetical protein CHLNCDRAFT_53357 [Chlorella variabilis]|eukprot:XP_005846098.1 hypothetical protein CHLNCDRAFT_53357 [Chlorella variabilis]
MKDAAGCWGVDGTPNLSLYWCCTADVPLMQYMEAVESVFGRRGAITLGWIQGILIFAGGQLLLSQTPSMDESWVASVVATAMSFGYSSIALGLSIGKVADGNVHGTLGGRESSDKVWGIFGAFGNVIFAYAFSMILIEIMDTVADAPPGFGDSQFLAAPSASSASTLKDPNAKDGSSLASGGSAAYAGPLPGAAPARDDRQRWQVVQMRKAVNWAMVIITFFFVSVGVFGYLAFGDVPCGTGGNVLTCYSSPRWLLIAANTMVYSQPVFFFVEGWIRHSPRFPAYASSRAAVISGRCFYVAVVAAISMMLPFFSDMVGLVGALGFWPATVLFPIEMYIRVYKPSRRAWWLLEALNLLCLVLTVCAVAGSVQQIVVDASTYSFFAD